GGADGIELEWETGSELSNLGFHLYRADRAEGPYHRLTLALVPGLGSSPEGARYRYLDRTVLPERTYYYELEDIETNGRTERHGPVSARVSETSNRGGGPSEDDEPSSAARLTFGEPERSTLSVLSRTDRSVVLELRTEGFYAEPDEDGSVSLSIPGYDEMEAKTLSLPVKRSWIQATVGRDARIASVKPSGVLRFESLRPTASSRLELEASRGGTVRARRRQGGRASASSGGTVPDAWAKLLSVAFQGEEKKALVELAPIRWDAARETLVLAKRLEVVVVFSGKDPNDLVTRTGRGLRGRAPMTKNAVIARLATKEPGLYGVSYDLLLAAARGPRQGFPAATLRLSRQGQPVAYHLEPSGRGFGPGTTLYFVSAGASANPYGKEAVYELETGALCLVMERVDA
ncbi:MAG: hypothetical protein ACRD1Z_07195, partial [Vicinamibacteria bacterium]